MTKHAVKLHPLAAAMILAGCPLIARSADFTVTSAADGGPGSLREAVMQANADPSTPHNIYFQLPPATTITLTSGEIAITRSMTLHGPGLEELTISGNSSSRIFRAQGANLDTAVISGMTLVDGFLDHHDYQESGGAAIMVHGNFTHLIVRDSLITGNHAVQGGGGGVRGMLGADISCFNSHLTDNQAASGGAIFLGGDLTLDECQISGNEAGLGGGVYVRLGHLEANASTISGNHATGGAGGILLAGAAAYYDGAWPASARITDSTLSGNTALGHGGCIAGYFAEVELIGGSLSDCEAGYDGGAVYVSGNSYIYTVYGDLTVAGTHFQDNQAGRYGGAIAGSLINAAIEDTIITGNSAVEVGGGLVFTNDSRLQMAASEITGNSAIVAAALAVNGNRAGSLLDRLSISGNHGSYAAVTAAAGDSLVLSNSLIADNQGQYSSGLGVYSQTLDLVNSTLAGNQVTTDLGSLHLASALTAWSSSLTMDNNTIAFNTSVVTDPEGAGAVAIKGGSIVTMTSNLLGANSDSAGLPEHSQIRREAGTSLHGQHNLLSHAAVDTFNGTDIGNLVVAEVGIQPLADNGGQSLTVALLPNSPARNAGLNPRMLPYDQRGPGYPRVWGPAPDIGAFEFGPAELVDVIFADRFEP